MTSTQKTTATENSIIDGEGNPRRRARIVNSRYLTTHNNNKKPPTPLNAVENLKTMRQESKRSLSHNYEIEIRHKSTSKSGSIRLQNLSRTPTSFAAKRTKIIVNIPSTTKAMMRNLGEMESGTPMVSAGLMRRPAVISVTDDGPRTENYVSKKRGKASVPVPDGTKGLLPWEEMKSSGFSFEDDLSGNSSSVGDAELSDSDTSSCSVSSYGGGICKSPTMKIGSRVRPCNRILLSTPLGCQLGANNARQVGSKEDCGSSWRALAGSVDRRLMVSKKQFLLSRTPQIPFSKVGVESRKDMKGMARQEDAHRLRLLDNCYVQWRYMNSKAQTEMAVRKVAAEESLYRLQGRIVGLQRSVADKRIELEYLKRRQSLLFILKAQMPYLDEWSITEDEFSISLLGLITAMQHATLRLPLAEDVKADAKELREVFDSLVTVVESLSRNVESLLPKAEGIEDIAKCLAIFVYIENDLVEECENLLHEAHSLQVKECSLRSQMIQLRQRSTK